MRIVVAEDLYLLRDGIVRLLDAYGHEIVATATTGPEALHAMLTQRPDIAIVDVRMPPTNTDEGLAAALSARANRSRDFLCSSCPSMLSSCTPANCSPTTQAVSDIS
ncbi:putative two-component response regulator [Nocardia brasiliensis NBRC 14402]|uniref:response regulator transcription factor n=1 Tax=Nocardia brasiliensis TaxID=37326 RepID=UPI0003142657|nr:response regulator [Nocardia brasiliensis]GAJ79537.1 putative two-component response regulator [Nocardia brasiliensis NBRC 14402]SUB55620.1 Probable transcriptional regulatory protein pdtaR [Nocardia brasiliensis]